MNGYIIKDVTCKYVLNSFLKWVFLTDYPGHVFNKEETLEISESGKSWNIQPVYKQSAVWTEDNGVLVTGQLEALYPQEK